MSLSTEAADDREAMATAARDAIDRRLRLLTGEDPGRFWSAVAKLYARGLPEVAPVGRVGITPNPVRTPPEAPPACLAAPAL